MKRAILALALFGLMLGSTGCAGLAGRLCKGPLIGSCRTAPENCAACDACGDPACRDRGCLARGHGYHGTPGPASGTITYPYYTTRGPRDFLVNNPPSIGPY
jgi:hypothetical protein